MSGPVDVEAFLDRLRGIASGWDSAHDELETLRSTATSGDELATATADSSGTLVALSLAPGLHSHGAARVAEAILEATGRAVGEANARRAALISEAVGLAVAGRGRDAAAGHAGP